MTAVKSFFRLRYVLPAAVALTLWSAPVVQASTIGFEGITNNAPGDTAIGEAQLFLEITDPGGGGVLFTFLNIGPEASSITSVYFDDGSLLSIDSINDLPPDVDFDTAGPGPAVLPGGNTITPSFVSTFQAHATTGVGGVPAHGVNPGESLGIQFDLVGGHTFDDVIAQLASGQLRVGIHVIGFESGGSESFVNVIPLPTTVWLLGSALIALTGVGYRRRRHR